MHYQNVLLINVLYYWTKDLDRSRGETKVNALYRQQGIIDILHIATLLNSFLIIKTSGHCQYSMADESNDNEQIGSIEE